VRAALKDPAQMLAAPAGHIGRVGEAAVLLLMNSATLLAASAIICLQLLLTDWSCWSPCGSSIG